jgi:hypothetical protein
VLGVAAPTSATVVDEHVAAVNESRVDHLTNDSSFRR